MDTRSEIDALARLLDGHAAPEASAEALALGALARSLGAAAPQPRAEFKSALRATLIDAARAQAASPPVLTRLRQSVDDTTARWRYSTRLAAATGAAALALSGGGVATAAQRALPGDVFYGVRLGLEDARLALLGDDVARGTQRLAYAGERVEDARAATAAGDHDGAARALREADASARDAARELLAASQERGDRAVLDRLDLFTREQRTRLAALAPLLRGPASQAGDDALVTLGRIDARVAVMTGRCAACDVAGGRAADVDLAEIPPADQPFTACPCVGKPTAGPGQVPVIVDSDDDAERDVTAPARRLLRKAREDAGRVPAPRSRRAPQPVDKVDKIDDDPDDAVDDRKPIAPVVPDEPAPPSKPRTAAEPLERAPKPKKPETPQVRDKGAIPPLSEPRDEANEIVDEVGDVVDDVVDEVLDDPPVDPPDPDVPNAVDVPDVPTPARTPAAPHVPTLP